MSKTSRREIHEKAARGPSRPKLVSAEESRKLLNDLHTPVRGSNFSSTRSLDKPVKTSKPPKAV